MSSTNCEGEVRNRMIKPEFWTDERTGRLTDSSKIIFIAMFNIADDEGKLNGDLSYLLSTIYPYGNCSKIRLRNSLEELKESCLIIPYSVKKFQYILIPNFNKHQRIDKPQTSKIPDPVWDSIPVKEYFFNYQNGICPDCNGEMELLFDEKNAPNSYDFTKTLDEDGSNNELNPKLLTIYGIEPESKGGSHNILNLRALCVACSKKKQESIPRTSQEQSENIPEKDFPKRREVKKKRSKEENKEKEKELTPPPLPYSKLVEHWNSFAKEYGLSAIVSLSSKRTKSIQSRLKETAFKLDKIFEEIALSDFLRGKNERGWKVDFDFVFCSANNYLKIIEGKYRTNGADRKQYRKGDLDFNKYQRELATEGNIEEETEA